MESKEQPSKPQEETKESGENFGNYELIQSHQLPTEKYTKLLEIGETLVGQTVLVRARVQRVKVIGKIGFLILREQYITFQATLVKSETITSDFMKFVGKIPHESVVDITATVAVPVKPIDGCTEKRIELFIQKIFVVSRAATLPIQIEDLAKKESEESAEGEPRVLFNTRLDNRVIDLRTPSNLAIFKLQSAVCQLFREFLYTNGFMEIHTPKLLGGSSEGGASVFRLKYFGKDCCLAQSPQLAKQMCVMGDFNRVFEIGPVFRAENANTHRHLCEFTGLDIEMEIKHHYFEVLDVLSEMFLYIFEGLEKRFAKELAVVQEHYGFEPFKTQRPVLRLTFEEGIKLLHESGAEVSPLEDLSTEMERRLGKLVREKYSTDFYILHRYPASARPFYTMPCKDNANYTNSYDFFMRGEEILSGAQRVHEPALLEERIKAHGIPLESIQYYIDSFKYGAFPHGGAGIGLERFVMFYCNLGNIRRSSLFPRDPHRLLP